VPRALAGRRIREDFQPPAIVFSPGTAAFCDARYVLYDIKNFMAGDAYGKRAKRPYSKLFQMFM
jgi:hypothetical protein